MKRYQAVKFDDNEEIYIAIIIKKNGQTMAIGEDEHQCILFNSKEKAEAVAKDTFEKYIKRYPEER